MKALCLDINTHDHLTKGQTTGHVLFRCNDGSVDQGMVFEIPVAVTTHFQIGSTYTINILDKNAAQQN